MKISVLGTGMVGQTIASKMLELGHEVYMGTRNAAETKSREEVNKMTGKSFAGWYSDNSAVNVVNFSELPFDTDLFVNATSGGTSLDALKAVGKDLLRGKTVVDIANPLDFSKGMPPTLSVCNTDSLAEMIQREFPECNVVKSLNTMNCFVMMDPSLVPGDHAVFMAGNDDLAKSLVRAWLGEIGWRPHNIHDLGDITAARGTEMMLPVWLRLFGAIGSPNFNFGIVKG